MSQHRFDKHFERSEAQAWIPRLQGYFEEIRAAIAEVRDDVRILVKQKQRVGGNGGGIDVTRYFSQDSHIHAILTEIQGAGIVLQDVERGLIDFPHLMDGEEVLLCWEVADGGVLGWYHPLHTGYAGRLPLPDL